MAEKQLKPARKGTIAYRKLLKKISEGYYKSISEPVLGESIGEKLFVPLNEPRTTYKIEGNVIQPRTQIELLEGVALPPKSLIEKLLRLKEFNSSAYVAGKNTLSNYLRKYFIDQDPYWRAGELVPTEYLNKIRDVDRRIYPKYPGHLEEVKSQILEGITKDYPYAVWNPKINNIFLGEGNTRTGIAYEQQFPAIPLRILNSLRTPHRKLNIGVPSPYPPNKHGYIPSELKPSQLGIDYYDFNLEDPLVRKILENLR